MKNFTISLVILLILIGCSSTPPNSSTVEYSDHLSGSSISESTASFNIPQVSESPTSSTEPEQEISESLPSSTVPEQEISESLPSSTEPEQEISGSDDTSFTPAPIGKPDNFTVLLPDRTETLPFSENDIKEIEFYTLTPKYGGITTANKNIIKEIISFINGLQISDSAWTGTQKPGLFVRFHLKDGTDTEINMVDKGIEINTKMYSVADGEKYTQFENLLDKFVAQSFVDKGLLSIKGTVKSSRKMEQYTYLYELDTASGLKAIKVTQGVNDILRINRQADYPLKENQTILVFYKKEGNPIIPEAILLY